MVLLRNTLIISASLLILSGLGFGQTETAKNSESKGG